MSDELSEDDKLKIRAMQIIKRTVILARAWAANKEKEKRDRERLSLLEYSKDAVIAQKYLDAAIQLEQQVFRLNKRHFNNFFRSCSSVVESVCEN